MEKIYIQSSGRKRRFPPQLAIAMVYGAEFVIRNKVIILYLNNGVYRYYIQQDVLRFTSNSWYNDINTDNL